MRGPRWVLNAVLIPLSPPTKMNFSRRVRDKRRVLIWACSALIFAAIPPNVVSAETAQQGSEQLALTAYIGGTVFDGTGSAAIEDATIIVQDGEIAAFGPHLEVPGTANVVNITGKWVVPGLVDTHVHFFESGRIYNNPRKVDLEKLVTFEEEVKWIKRRLPLTLNSILCAGVTSVVSLGGPSVEFQARDMAAQMDRSPRVFLGYGPFTVVPENLIFEQFDGESSVVTVSTRDDIVRQVKKAHDNGASLIKTGYLGFPGEMEAGYPDVLTMLLEESAKYDLPVTLHLTSSAAFDQYSSYPVLSIQHTPTDGPIGVHATANLVRQKTLIVPTLAVRERSEVNIIDKKFDLEPIEKSCGDPEVIESWMVSVPEESAWNAESGRQALSLAMETVMQLKKAGIGIAAGSDAGNMGLLHGASLHHELKFLSLAGLSPAEVITAATLNAARAAGIEDEVGSIEPGKVADFLILDVDPLADISNLQRLNTVVSRGRAFSAESLIPDYR